MKPQALIRWARSAWEVAGSAAPILIGRYGRLTVLNRTSRERLIRKVPALAHAPARALASPQGDVVVPVYNNFADTRVLLAALEADSTIPGRIILVHDGSTDARVGPLLRAYAQRDARVDLLENEKNLGFVRTCNRGLMASHRDAVILNTDIVLPPGAVVRMLARLQSDPAIASVTPLSNCAYGVGLPDLFYDNPMPFGALPDDIDLALRALPTVEAIDLASGIGFCMGMSRAVIDAIGPFDEAFGLGYGEETDFCMRAAKRGYRHVLATDCYVGHKGGQSFGTSWQDLSRKGTLKVLHRHPVFADKVARYLEAGETRALGFAALVRLAESLSGKSISVVRGSSASPEAGEAAPKIVVTSEGEVCNAALVWRGERYVYRFASAAAFDATLALARTTPAPAA